MAVRHMVVQHNIIVVCVHVDPEMCQCPEGGRNKGRASSKVPRERKTGCMECALVAMFCGNANCISNPLV